MVCEHDGQEGKRSGDQERSGRVAKEVVEVAKEVVEMAKKVIRVFKEVVEVTERMKVVLEANVVVDALSKKERFKPKKVRAMNMTIRSSIKDKILAAQNEAFEVVNAPATMLRGLNDQMKYRSDGALYNLNRIWVPLIGDVRILIMDEGHKSKYSVYPRADKMYYDLRDTYWF
uniref:Putative reverse transcriptase domain-containing protein n=1 Tax=Tanacetum cinerariifolium TaxID=118510 RepID=A0A6L2N1Q2_TANCI|nr:putative reverse transcriptase domain-containing protein [Tanacetum cinerariifolium]